MNENTFYLVNLRGEILFDKNQKAITLWDTLVIEDGKPFVYKGEVSRLTRQLYTAAGDPVSRAYLRREDGTLPVTQYLLKTDTTNIPFIRYRPAKFQFIVSNGTTFTNVPEEYIPENHTKFIKTQLLTPADPLTLPEEIPIEAIYEDKPYFFKDLKHFSAGLTRLAHNLKINSTDKFSLKTLSSRLQPYGYRWELRLNDKPHSRYGIYQEILLKTDRYGGDLFKYHKRELQTIDKTVFKRFMDTEGFAGSIKTFYELMLGLGGEFLLVKIKEN